MTVGYEGETIGVQEVVGKKFGKNSNGTKSCQNIFQDQKFNSAYVLFDELKNLDKSLIT